MGMKQLPKCKESTCQFCKSGKFCTILNSKPEVCRFYKATKEKD
jgi:Fe-S-cluster containining protein